MNAVRKDALKAPVSHIIIISLFAVGGISIPLDWFFAWFIKDALVIKLLAETTIRVILTVVAVYFIFKYRFNRAFTQRCPIISIIAVLPALLVAVNNFPIIGVMNGNVKIYADTTQLVVYVLFCLSVGLYEEVVFRGLIFPLCYYALRKIKWQVFWSVALSSAIFGIIHIINLFAGAGFGATVLQVGYSFLIGAMCAISILIAKNLFVAIFLHAVYDVGGLLLSYVAFGNQWDNVTVIVTVVLGVIVAIYMVLVCIKTPSENLRELYFSDVEMNFTENKKETNL